jgi:hypothetical protein
MRGQGTITGTRAGLAGAFLCLALAAVALFLALTSSKAALPNDATHLGVASCGGTTCHGRQYADGKVVRQDEILRWQEPSSEAGAHSRAFAVLGNARGRKIAARLGIGNPQSAGECLGCHADPGKRGAQFHLSDGVGCEACHGGAQNWLASHYTVGASHNANVTRGMVPLDRPMAKAAVCLDCHFGSADGGQFVTHRIMAAGHPRISFELDLFSTLQQHWNEDSDYAQRKGRTNNVRVWAVGQAMAVDRALSLYTGALGQDGSFPQFYFYDCHSCHRAIRDGASFSPTVLTNPGRPLPPGTPPFNDENMIMLSAAARVAAPALGQRFDADSRAFHAAMAQGRPQAVAAAARLRASAQALANAFNAGAFNRATTFAMLDAIGSEAIAPRFTDFTGSTQAVMAMDTLLNALVSQGAVSAAAAAGVRGDINRAYAAVKDANAYRPLEYRQALGSAIRGIRSLR